MHTFYIVRIQGFKDVLAKPSHNAIGMEFSRFLLIPMFSSESFTLVKILDTISFIFRFLSIIFLNKEFRAYCFFPTRLPIAVLCHIERDIWNGLIIS